MICLLYTSDNGTITGNTAAGALVRRVRGDNINGLGVVSVTVQNCKITAPVVGGIVGEVEHLNPTGGGQDSALLILSCTIGANITFSGTTIGAFIGKILDNKTGAAIIDSTYTGSYPNCGSGKIYS